MTRALRQLTRFSLVLAATACDSTGPDADDVLLATVRVLEAQVTADFIDEADPAGGSRYARVPVTLRYENSSTQTVYLRTCASRLAVELVRRGEMFPQRVVCGLDVLSYETLAPGAQLERSVDLLRCLEGACRGELEPRAAEGTYQVVGWYSSTKRQGEPDFTLERALMSGSFEVVAPPAVLR